MRSLKPILEQLVNDYANPKPWLEQYRTPPELALQMTRYALMFGCSNGVIVDLGAGTGMLSYAAAASGAGYVVGLDVDPDAVKIALGSELYRILANVDLVVAAAEYPPLRSCGCAVMNPPFGIHRRGADTAFLLAAIGLGCTVIVSLHHLTRGSVEHVMRLCREKGYRVLGVEEHRFPLKHSMPYHRKRIHYIRVALVVCKRAVDGEDRGATG